VLACTAGLRGGLGATHGAVAGQLRELVREATPLVLKDGRIAHVAIWSVPFRPGATELDGEVRGELAGLVETLATDCFLTAQAIGHVEPEAAKSGESLAAHRLARARADRIQQAMVERGLQASAIASVWDWQFLVKEPRVTVWVFRLHEGDDCEGKRLERPTATPSGTAAAPPGARELPVRAAAPLGDRPPAATSTPSPGAPAAPAEPPRAQAKSGAPAKPSATPTPPPSAVAAAPPTVGPAPIQPMPGSTPPPRPAAAVRPPTPQAAPSLPGASASASEVLVSPLQAQAAPDPAAVAGAPPAPADPAPPPSAPPERRPPRTEPAKAPAVPTKVGAEPIKVGEEPREAAAAEAGAVGSARTAVAALDTGAATAGPGSLELVFDTNSSYLPRGATAELRAFLKALPAGTASEVELVAAVGGADVKESSGASGVRYNRWLAERRLARVADWLKENAGGRRLKITTGYQDDDPSRRVTLRLRAGG
jgi:outer membrane protein OmpA-like peptidoglycan-associated protein